jgi:hypothetical protein
MTGAWTLLLAVATAPVAPAMPSPAAELVDATLDVCYPAAKNELKLGVGIEEDTKALKLRHIAAGLSQVTMDRLGRSALGFVSQSVIGERRVGDDIIVLAVGGRMPGCRSILLSKSMDNQAAKVATILSFSNFREVPASNQPGTAVNRRMFVRRGPDGTPYLINMFTGTLPQSDFRLMTTVNAVPPGVQLPQGF